MNIQHSSRSDLWYTPKHIIEMCREVLGSIDLDPASDKLANEVVKASEYFDEGKNGLTQDWYGNIFLNPPGGKTRNKSNTILFWGKLMNSNFKHAIFLAFSIEALQNSQGKGFKSIGEYTLCIPSKRIKFVYPFADKTQPSHSNVICYVPGTVDNSEKFRETFKTLGVIIQ